MSKKKNNMQYIIVAMILIFILGVMVGNIITGEKIEEIIPVEIFPMEPSLEDYLETKLTVSGNILTYVADCKAISFGVTQDQAFSIARGLRDEIETRPLTHDSIKDIFESFDLDIISARIDELEDGIYYAKLLIKQGDMVLDLDVRPSDATAMAVRYEKPIYIKKTLLEENGIDVC